MTRIVALSVVLAALALAACQGCVGRAINEGVEETLGPTAMTFPLDPKWSEGDTAVLGSYRNFELAPLKSEFPDTPAEFLSYFPARFREQLADKALPMLTGGKTAIITVTVLAYQPASSIHKALGPTEEVVARVELTDKGTGQVIGRAVCIGRTYQSVGLGTKWKAWGLARAIVNEWIDKHYPREGRKDLKETPPPSE